MIKNKNLNKYISLIAFTSILCLASPLYAPKDKPLVDDDDTAVLRILTEDGGAIRGPHTEGTFTWELWHAANGHPLSYDEKIEPYRKLQEELDIPFARFFHGYVGTSVGSIQAAAFAAGLPIHRFHEILESEESRIFENPRSKWLGGGTVKPYYDPEGMESVLTDLIGKEVMLSDIDHCLLMVVANNPKKRESVFFSNWDARDLKGKPIPSRDASLIDVVMASSSPFPYFPPRTVKFSDGHTQVAIDGGFGVNNPSSVAWDKINYDLLSPGTITTPKKATKLQIFSLGTGLFKGTGKAPTNIYDTLQYTIAMATQSSLTHQQMRFKPQGHYYRWNVPLSEKENVFATSDQKILDSISQKSRKAWQIWEHREEVVKIFETPRSTEITHPWIDFSKIPKVPSIKTEKKT